VDMEGRERKGCGLIYFREPLLSGLT